MFGGDNSRAEPRAVPEEELELNSVKPTQGAEGMEFNSKGSVIESIAGVETEAVSEEEMEISIISSKGKPPLNSCITLWNSTDKEISMNSCLFKCDGLAQIEGINCVDCDDCDSKNCRDCDVLEMSDARVQIADCIVCYDPGILKVCYSSSASVNGVLEIESDVIPSHVDGKCMEYKSCSVEIIRKTTPERNDSGIVVNGVAVMENVIHNHSWKFILVEGIGSNFKELVMTEEHEMVCVYTKGDSYKNESLSWIVLASCFKGGTDCEWSEQTLLDLLEVNSSNLQLTEDGSPRDSHENMSVTALLYNHGFSKCVKYSELIEMLLMSADGKVLHILECSTAEDAKNEVHLVMKSLESQMKFSTGFKRNGIYADNVMCSLNWKMSEELVLMKTRDSVVDECYKGIEGWEKSLIAYSLRSTGGKFADDVRCFDPTILGNFLVDSEGAHILDRGDTRESYTEKLNVGYRTGLGFLVEGFMDRTLESFEKYDGEKQMIMPEASVLDIILQCKFSIVKPLFPSQWFMFILSAESAPIWFSTCSCHHGCLKLTILLYSEAKSTITSDDDRMWSYRFEWIIAWFIWLGKELSSEITILGVLESLWQGAVTFNMFGLRLKKKEDSSYEILARFASVFPQFPSLRTSSSLRRRREIPIMRYKYGSVACSVFQRIIGQRFHPDTSE